MELEDYANILYEEDRPQVENDYYDSYDYYSMLTVR